MELILKTEAAGLVLGSRATPETIPRVARLIQALTDEGVLHAAEGGGGRGHHRRYDLRQVGYAIIAWHLTNAGFSVKATGDALELVEAHDRQTAVSIIDYALSPSFPEGGNPVSIAFDYAADVDSFVVELEPANGEASLFPLRLVLRLDVMFAELRAELRRRAGASA